MFKCRKAEWFQPKRIGWGLTPRTWQGFVWAILWAFVLIIPACSVAAGNWFWGSLVFAALFSVLMNDVVCILQELKANKKQI